MKRALFMVTSCLSLATLESVARAETLPLRVGFCARTLSGGAAPFAVAVKMGWFRQEGIEVIAVPHAGSSDCVKNVTARLIPFALAAVEPQAVARLHGIKIKTFYTAYQGNIFRLAVPADSAIQKIVDLKGKTIGVASLGAGVLFAKAMIAMAGMDPEKDVKIVVAGEGAQTAVMLRSKQVDALSQFDTQFAMVENAGVKLRFLDANEIDRLPGNGFIALEETLNTRRKEAVALARGYAKGTLFTINNPEGAVRMLYEVFPASKPTGKDEATVVREETRVVQARVPYWTLARGGVTRWGESSEANYASYLDFLLKWGVINAKVTPQDLVTNELIPEINRFDANAIVADAKAYQLR
jgi:NitT/TauT family transport system substrate-binding protein